MAKRKTCSKKQLNGPRVKKKKSRLQLSDLPSDILHYIISQLPIKEAARTSILSKHWKDVWCSCRNLKFSFKSLFYNKKCRIPYSSIKEQVFIDRVNTVLNQHSGVAIEKLEFEFSSLHNEHAEYIDGWLKFSIASKTLDFTFVHPPMEPYSFPFQLFDATTGSQLQSMKLGSVSLKQPSNIKSPDVCSALAYIFTEFPSTLPRLEMLTIRCQEIERADMLDKPLKFTYLRHLRLELNFVSLETRTTDVLDLACLLEAAAYMEKLELHMWMDCTLERYRKRHGELRSLPSQLHSHLKVVNMTGFYGQKDQVELALHILGNASVLETMKINPKPMVAAINVLLTSEDGFCFVDGYRAAKKYLFRADHRGVVDVVKVRRRDVENVWPYKLVDPYWIALEAEQDR
ncbi:uncharacterized protein C2845_PM08G17600 [Panicum miliaceum]|uniref:F-box domain-containing protein n=1 Tax=Panicum miliaceum TaxID=4540 RepID=A0A3L6QZE8_PANMI|nr:uncharacterized protein C2845_PM08G17600 [Panicum miliaceum]